jgi:CheY-like chemotaxis protein
MRVVLAEDDVQFRRLLATALRGDGYDVVEANDGQELVDRIVDATGPEAQSSDPIIVVSDIQMPGLGGLDVLAALECAGRQLPIILITAFADEDVRAEARSLGARMVLSKPFALNELRGAVERLSLEAYQHRSGSSSGGARS